MTRSRLQQRAHAAGICTHWRDAQGASRALSEDTVHALLDVLAMHESHEPPDFCVVKAGDALPDEHGARVLLHEQTQRECPLVPDRHGRTRAPAQPGYYVQQRRGQPDRTVAVVPARCISVAELADDDGARCWGVAAQVYGVRREYDGGLGDSLGIAELGSKVAEVQGDAIALSPLHAATPMDVHFSPYSPSHRAWLDTLQIAPAQVAGTQVFRAALEYSGQADAWARAERRLSVDWPAQDAMRRKVWRSLAQLWAHTPAVAQSLDEFTQAGGRALRLHATFAARQRVAHERHEDMDWRRWPAAWRDPESTTVAAFAHEHADDVALEIFAQWLASACWQGTHARLRKQGQRIGLIWDLATGFQPGGSEAWQQHSLVMDGIRIGAPPDAFNTEGQDWGLAAFAPAALRRSGYRPLREVLAQTMARGGGLRIDHILGWSRLWLVPEGLSAREGGYVRFPLHDMLGLLALESWLHRCMVIGEDLGTVPADLRDTLSSSGVMGIDVLQFTRDPRGRFLDPCRWRNHAVAMSSTHDLPPLEGWRAGSDIDALARIQHWGDDARATARTRRLGDVAQLDRMLERFPARTPRQAALQAVAESPSPLVLLPLEDVLGESQQPNLPGTTHRQHPNWRRRLAWRRPKLFAALRLVARHRKAHLHA